MKMTVIVKAMTQQKKWSAGKDEVASSLIGKWVSLLGKKQIALMKIKIGTIVS